jgi:HlyD family secretion protein
MRTGIALLVVFATACFSGFRSDPVKSLTVHKGTFLRDVTLTGELNAADGATVVVPRLPQWQTSIKWLSTDGAEVRAGDRVVELDSGPFSSNLDAKRQAVIQAEQQLTQKKAEWAADLEQKQLDQARKRVDADKATLDAAIPQDLVSARDYADRQMKLKRASVELAKAEDDLKAQRVQVASDRANLDVTLGKARRELQEAGLAIAALTLRAARSGIVVVRDHPWQGRKLQEGDGVWVGLPLAMIPEPSSLRVEAQLPDVDDGRIAIGNPATIVLDAFPELTFTGRVAAISAVAQESAQASLRRAFRVLVQLDRIDSERMRPGLSARVIVRVDNRPALLASRSALDLNGSRTRARIEGGRLVDVKLGPCNAQECVVLDGLREGVSLAPLHAAKELSGV